MSTRAGGADTAASSYMHITMKCLRTCTRHTHGLRRTQRRPRGFLFSTDWTLREDRVVERPSPARRAILRSRRPRWTTPDVRRGSASTGRKDWTMNDLMDGPCGAVPGPPARERGHRHGVGRGGRTAGRWAPLV